MQRLLSTFLLGCLTVYFISCEELPRKHWTAAVPQKTPGIIIPPENVSPSDILENEYIPLLDDISSSAIQLVSQIDSYPTVDLNLKAILLYPGVLDRLQLVWIIEAPDFFIQNLQQSYYEKFTQNKYTFQGITIHKLHIQDRILYATHLHNLLFLSESSLGIEDAIRSYLGLIEPANVHSLQVRPSTFLLNTPSMDQWIEQLLKVAYRPNIIDSFRGTEPAVLQVEKKGGQQKNEYLFSGNIPLNAEPRSELIAALSTENAPITLDRYISSNAAAFAIFRLPPRLAPPGSLPDTTRLDSLLIKDKVRYANLARDLSSEFALVAYAESGFLSVGEHLYLRKLKDPATFRNRLRNLASEGFLQEQNNIFFARSPVLARLIGSELNNYHDFYIDVTGEIAVISKRKGLAELVASDRSRRRVIYYDENFLDLRRSLPDQVSGFVFANTDFYKFIRSYLGPNANVNALTSKFNLLSITLELDSDQNQLAFNLRTYAEEESTRPYEEQWFFPTGGAELSGKPVLADIRGSQRDEIIFATSSGTVYALASDGTVVMQANTGEDRPIGSPVVYDWYGTNQKVILLPAGNKIYGWNDTGTILPKFPFELSETITTPLTVTDFDLNGLPEAMLATSDRQLHVLDGRGNNIDGWPQTTNAVIRQPLFIDRFSTVPVVVAFSENAVHAWNRDGVSVNGFPRFINASLTSPPYVQNRNVLGGAADGYLYSIGPNRLFSDSLNVYSNTATSTEDGVEAVYVSNSPLIGTPRVYENLTVQSDEERYREDMILTVSSNGSVFLINTKGQLRFTKSMGQPAARNFSPFVADINNDGNREVVSLADFGRLYAWELLTGERIFSLPTNGMKYPVITDLDNDGNKELIAQTRDGVRAWSIYEQSRDEEEEKEGRIEEEE